MIFLDRENEKQRLDASLSSDDAQLVVIYGRRRIGKSTLIRQVLKESDIYFLAHLSNAILQREQFAEAIAEQITGFNDVIYPSWESLFSNLRNSLRKPLTICIDEFPYLVKKSPELPSLIQKIFDEPADRSYHLVLCGSSQQMMQGLVLDSSAPLYGRANQILKINPLHQGWIQEAIHCYPVEAVQEFSVWGGIPRYWELRAQEDSFESAIKNQVLDRLGVLHEEPLRLLADDMRESVQAFSILTLVGRGIQKLSEIAARLGKPATHISRPLDKLIQLGYLKRETPYGTSPRSGKKSLYKISDPFINFYFTFVESNLSRLELGLIDQVYRSITPKLSHYVANEWENMCRTCIPFEPLNGIEFNAAARWWGTNINGDKMELDLVCESLDKKYLLVGECKWSTINNPERLLYELRAKAELLPGKKPVKILTMLFVRELKQKSKPHKQTENIFTPIDVLKRLRN
ncbi:MAG: ATP-binding protein [Bacteroidetes bacterium]|nr:ATP-binding protein [Bacteroidota bacterium]MBT3750285.1 ATP-binding protein [Bacteroidota bacterium]MBT4400979.1 ATP-binding protein [Bacteroidota bacterium]MBT4411651.1 ATP-binding protein [Bacteroidota bacterium]MBT5428230.1 ATP-binding protein [Bacteroidota bacterium]